MRDWEELNRRYGEGGGRKGKERTGFIIWKKGRGGGREGVSCRIKRLRT